MIIQSYIVTHSSTLKGLCLTIARVIFLETMVTPISSHTKDKNSMIFAAQNEDEFFSKVKNPGISLVFI